MLYFSLENEESKPFRQRLTSVGVSPFGFGKNVNLVFDDEGTAFLESRGDFLACYTKDGIVHRLAEGKTGRQILQCHGVYLQNAIIPWQNVQGNRNGGTMVRATD